MYLGSLIEFRTEYKICAFNQLDKDIIISSFKNVFNINEVWTGKEFCEVLGIDYEEIINQRRADAIDNYLFVVETLVAMEDIQNKVFENAKIIIDEDGVHFKEDK